MPYKLEMFTTVSKDTPADAEWGADGGEGTPGWSFTRKGGLSQVEDGGAPEAAKEGLPRADSSKNTTGLLSFLPLLSSGQWWGVS